MDILNPAVRSDLHAGRPLRLNLGSGARPRPGFYNVDRLALPGVDIVADLNEPFSALPNDCVEAVYCRHTLEHVGRFMELMAEIHRVVRPQGRVEVIVPHFSNPFGYSDPTHVRFFGLYSFSYFCDPEDQPRHKVPSFYLPQRFQVESVRCNLFKNSPADRLLRLFFQPLINRSVGWLHWYEKRLCHWVPASDLHFVLRVKKSASTALDPNSMAA